MGAFRGNLLPGGKKKWDTDGNITRRRFGKLIATGETRTTKDFTVEWEFLCNCGKYLWMTKPELRHIQDRFPYIQPNCGCWDQIYVTRRVKECQENRTEAGRLWEVYQDMFDRVRNPEHPYYKKEHDIEITDDWKGEDGWKNFVYWSYWEGKYQEQTPENTEPDQFVTITRRKKAGIYEPSNCVWRVWPNYAKKEETIEVEHHIWYNGMTFTFPEFAVLVGLTEDELQEFLDQKYPLSILIWNFIHPKDALILREDNEWVDEHGFYHIVPKYDVEVLD